MAWFKHKIGDHQFIDELVIQYGSDGYYVYYRTIEVMAENYNIEKPAENLFHWDYYFAKFYTISKKKLTKILNTFSFEYKTTSGKSGIHFENRDTHLFLKCKKLEELADRWTKETVKKLSSNGTVTTQKLDCIDRDKDKEVDKDKETNTIVRKKAFDEFWFLYGKNVGEDKCRKWYVKNVGKKKHLEIMDGLKRWWNSGQWDDTKWQPYPYKFLNNEMWKDNPPKKQLSPKDDEIQRLLHEEVRE